MTVLADQIGTENGPIHSVSAVTASTTGNSSQSLHGNVGDAGAGDCGVAAWVMLGLVGKGVRARDVLPAVRLQPEAGGEAFGSPAVNQSVGSTSWMTTRTAVAGDPQCPTAASVTARAQAAFCLWLRPAARKRLGEGKRVAVRVDLRGGRILQKK